MADASGSRKRKLDGADSEEAAPATSTPQTVQAAAECPPAKKTPATDTSFGFERRIRAGAARYHCNYCQRDITNLFRIKCAECADFDLCLECFSVGVEVFPHQKTHKYRVMDNMTFPIFDPAWGADEELLLLEAIQMYGMGNWIDVSEHVGTKTLAECKDHYFKTFLEVPTIPLPDPARAVDPTKTERRPVTNKPERREMVRGPKVAPNLNDSRTLNAPKPSTNKADGINIPQTDIAGYMALRNDFESEYDNDAEMIIADMEILPTDAPEDRKLKTRLLQIYDAKLNERGRRKGFVLERGLLDFKRQHAAERRKPKEERELTQRLKMFARFHNKEEHQQLIDGILRERELRRRIALLQEYRRAGIRTLSEAHNYHVDKKKHEEEMRKAGEDGSSRGRGSRYLGRDRSIGSCPSWQPQKFLRKSAMLDISQCQGVEMLSDKEKHLCSTLRIVPKQYMLIKDVLLRECERVGYLKPEKASQMLKIEAVKTGKLYEFFVSSGWVKQGHTSGANVSNK